MKENFERALQLVLVHEGGFANHPLDPGGATMKGVTLQTFRRFFGADKTVHDLRHITPEQLAQVYRTGYWDTCRCDQLPPGVDYAVFDVAVNSGPGRAARFLQAAVGANQDGAIGPETLGKVEANDAQALIHDLCDQRLAFLRGLATFSTFGVGWSKRVADVRHHALDMALARPMPGRGLLTSTLQSCGSVRKVPGWSSSSRRLGSTQTAYLAPQTEAALKRFQQIQGLEVDGIAGRNTYRALGLIG